MTEPRFPLALAAAGLMLASACSTLAGGNAPAAGDDGAPRPYDPSPTSSVSVAPEPSVDPATRKDLEGVALEAARPYLGSDRAEVVSILIPGGLDSESQRACGPRDCYRVAIYDYPKNVQVFVVIEQDSHDVNDVRSEPVDGEQPSLTDREVDYVHSLADADAEVQRLLAGRTHSHAVLAYPMAPDKGPCALDRCATTELLIEGGEGDEQRLNVLVDLSRDEILERRKITCSSSGECSLGW